MDSIVTPDGTGTPAPDGGGLPPELLGATGANAQLGWRAQLPDDLKTNEAFTTYKNVGELAKTYLDATGKLRDLEGRLANSIPKPSDTATPEEKAAYFQALGRPEAPDKYQFEPATLPPGMNIDPSLESWFKNTAFEIGLNNGQAGSLYKEYMGMLSAKYSEAMQTQARVREETLTKLYTEWGDKKTENMETIKRAMAQFGDKDLVQYFDETGKGNDPALINFFLKVGKAMSEDTFARGNIGGMSTGLKNDPKTNMPIFEYPSMQENSGG